MSTELIKDMTDNRFQIIDATIIGDRYKLAIYRGSKSESQFDFVVRYREYIDGKWSRIRTPKHLHWIMDILIKRSHDKNITRQFVLEFEKLWNTIVPIKTQDELQNLIKSLDNLYVPNISIAYGLHNVEFLYKMMYLIMVQEKTNYPNGSLTREILNELKDSDDWFGLLNKGARNG